MKSKVQNCPLNENLLRRALEDLKLYGDPSIKLSLYEVERCFEALTLRKFSIGETIFLEGDMGDSCYILTSGALSISKEGSTVYDKHVAKEPGHVMGFEVFGEHSLVCSCSRTITLKALEDCIMWRLGREDFQKATACGGALRAVQRVSEFACLTRERQLLIAQKLQRIETQTEDVILRGGARSQGIYIIEVGECLSSNQNPQNELLEPPKQLWRLGPGDFFGEETTCLNINAFMSVFVSSAPTSLYFLDNQNFREIIPLSVRSKFRSSCLLRLLSQSEAFGHYIPQKLEQHIESITIVSDYIDGQLIFDSLNRVLLLERNKVRKCIDMLAAIVVVQGSILFLQTQRNSKERKLLGRVDTGEIFSFETLCDWTKFNGSVVGIAESDTKLIIAEKPKIEIEKIAENDKEFLKSFQANMLEYNIQILEHKSQATEFPLKNALDNGLALQNLIKEACSPRKRERVPFCLRSNLILSLQSLQTLDILGQGAFGTVKLVKNKETLALYAMKFIKSPSKQNKNNIERIYREREILQKLGRHPFIVSLFRAFDDLNGFYMLLEPCFGGDLFEFIEQRSPQKLRLDECKFFTAQIVLGIKFIHESKIVYRDLKPENVILSREGYIRLIDFGMAKELTEPKLRTSTLCGTSVFIAPEVFRQSSYSFSIDWWALGVLLYIMLLGEFPFEAKCLMSARLCLEAFCRAYPNDMIFQRLEISNSEPQAVEIIRELLDPDPNTRLGLGCAKRDILNHSFFDQYSDWEALFRKEYKPPSTVIEAINEVKLKNNVTSVTESEEQLQKGYISSENDVAVFSCSLEYHGSKRKYSMINE